MQATKLQVPVHCQLKVKHPKVSRSQQPSAFHNRITEFYTTAAETSPNFVLHFGGPVP